MATIGLHFMQPVQWDAFVRHPYHPFLFSLLTHTQIAMNYTRVRRALAILGFLLIAIAVVTGVRGWIRTRIPVQQIRDLHEPAIERQREIESLTKP
jgi:hypothetical protein